MFCLVLSCSSSASKVSFPLCTCCHQIDFPFLIFFLPKVTEQVIVEAGGGRREEGTDVGRLPEGGWAVKGGRHLQEEIQGHKS